MKTCRIGQDALEPRARGRGVTGARGELPGAQGEGGDRGVFGAAVGLVDRDRAIEELAGLGEVGGDDGLGEAGEGLAVEVVRDAEFLDDVHGAAEVLGSHVGVSRG